MTPKECAKYYAIISLILSVFSYFYFGKVDALYFLVFVIAYLVIYKISDHIDIRFANVLVHILVPLIIITLLNLFW